MLIGRPQTNRPEGRFLSGPRSNRACGFPAHGLPMTFSGCMRSSGRAVGAEQFVDAVFADETIVRPCKVRSDQRSVSATALMAAPAAQERPQAGRHITVDGVEMTGSVARAEVVAPPPQNR